MTYPMTDERLAELREAAPEDRLGLGGYPLPKIGDVIVNDDDIPALLARLDAAEDLLREVANSGVEFDDHRLNWIAAQIGRDTFTKCRSYLR